MSTTTITPTVGRIVWYRGRDGEVRAAIVCRVNGDFNLNLFVLGLDGLDAECGTYESVTHADPAIEPSCLPSWHWMPYQVEQAKKHAPAAPAASSLAPHQQRVIDELSELDDKLLKLTTFFGTPTFAALAAREQQLLRRQEEVMQEYSAILGERVAGYACATAG
jgi:hypothetical protein